MSKKKPKGKSVPVVADSKDKADPHAVLRHPSDPPRPNVTAFLIALAVFFAWFLFLVYVAVWGRT